MLVVIIWYCSDVVTNTKQILNISIYSRIKRMDSVSFGRHARLETGSADLSIILEEEMSRKYIERVQDKKPEEMLVMGKISNPISLSDC